MAIGFYSDTPPGAGPSIDNSGAFGFLGGAEYGEDLAIPANVETDLVTFTVPAGRFLEFTGGSGSGCTDTTFRFYVNGELKELRRIAWTDRNTNFKVGARLSTGDTVKITAEHHAVIAHPANAAIFGTLYIE